MTVSPRRSLALFIPLLLAALLLGAIGGLLLRDRPGLRFSFFPLVTDWSGAVLFTDVRQPRVDKVEDLAVAAQVIFSARWRGWLAVETSGRHDFVLWADDAGYLEIDGERVVDTTAGGASEHPEATVDLAKGLHKIEIGLLQRGGESGLGIEWTPPGGEPEVLPARLLYPRRPAGLYALTRRATAPLPRLASQLAGSLILLAALLLLRLAWTRRPPSVAPAELFRDLPRKALERLPKRLRKPLGSRRLLYATFFLGLFAVTWAAALPWSVATLGGDDAAYIMTARFGNPTLWYFNRMVHVYLLKAFIAIFGGGDSFLGSRVYGSFGFAVTLTALAVAVRSLGPRLQIRTLAITLFLLFSQATVTGALGAAFTDYTLMMLLTVAVAVFLHGRSVEHERPRHEWHALILGALTLAACKSKATGVIIFFLPALLLWAEGRIDWRRFLRRMAYWLGGLVSGLLVLMTLDAIWMNDFFHAVRPANFSSTRMFLVPGAPKPLPENAGWMHVLWPEGARGAALGLRNLWILVIVAPFVAATRRVALERRLFYLFPATYLLMMIVIYSRLPKTLYSARMLIPIMPAACLVAGAMFYHLGIEKIRARELVAPRCLVPLYLAAVAILLIVTPYLAGELTATDLVPLDYAARFGWQPEQFLRAAEIPAIVLAGILLAALFFRRRRARLAVALIATVALLGVSFQQDVRALAQRFTAQRTEVMLYPWRVFGDQIEEVEPDRIYVSPDLVWRLKMLGGIGRTHKTVGVIFFDRRVDVSLSRTLPADAEVAVASFNAYNGWRRARPELAEVATFDPSGQLVLLLPGGQPTTTPP